MSVLAGLLAERAAAPVGLSLTGGLIMALSVALVLGLNIFCLGRILREKKPAEQHQAPPDIDTREANG